MIVIAAALIAVTYFDLAERVGTPGEAGACCALVPSEVEILPSLGTRSACIVGTPGEPRPIFPLANGTLQGNTYDVPPGTTGHVGMCYDAASGTMLGYANWSHVGGSGGWFSYPQIAYGVNEYLGSLTTYTNQSDLWSLPESVATTVNESLWVTASYAFSPPPRADVDGYDLSFDDFLSQGLPPRFEAGPFVEVEIFLAHNISYPFQWAHWSTPTLVNGTIATTPWDVAYWCHGADNGSNANISFDFSLDGQGTHGLNDGTIGLNLSAFFGQVAAMMPSASCWTGPKDGFSGLYLDEEDLGSEDGAVGGTDFNYNWTVSSYCLHPQADPVDAAGVDCGEVFGHVIPPPSSARVSKGPEAMMLTGRRTELAR